jgi:hypothetical protein
LYSARNRKLDTLPCSEREGRDAKRGSRTRTMT